MIRKFFLACILSLYTFQATALEMTTVETYLKENDFKNNPGAATHVFLRCSTLMLMLGNYLDDQRSSSGDKKMGTHFKSLGNQFLELVISSENFDREFANSQMKLMADAYKERWLKAKALTGNFSDDPVLRSDINVCTAIVSKPRR